MSAATAAENREFRRVLGRTVAWPLILLTVLSLALVGQILYLRTLHRWVDRTDRVIAQAHHAMRLFLDAETGMRGFLLTREEVYLAPFVDAERSTVPVLAGLEAQVSDNPAQRHRFVDLEARWEQWVRLANTRILNQRSGTPPTREQADQGRLWMEGIRGTMASIIAEEEALRAERSESATEWSWIFLAMSGLGALSLGVVLAIGGRRQLLGLAQRYETALTAQVEQTQRLSRAERLTRGRADLGAAVQGELTEAETGQRVLAFFAATIGARVGLLYRCDQAAQVLELTATRAAARDGSTQPPARIPLGSGALGQAAADRALRVLSVPSDHVQLVSATGASRSRHLLLAPITMTGELVAMVELALAEAPGGDTLELVQATSDVAGAALTAARYREALARLLAETQRQAETLERQQEELRVSNEELHAQSEILRRSQAELETQQQDLEASNRTLTEQAQSLEEAQATLVEKADLLARANEYKSEFLANMSHELRTPLNSALILAKLLSDNKPGNLTPEQVKFAETIHAAGNDLLELINDILDLSRIEAGRMELELEEVHLTELTDGLERTFRPIAEEKSLVYRTVIDPTTPETLSTDPRRLQQILKNLVSNALKFTERGEVVLRVSPSGNDRVAFAVRDTGIGIPTDMHEIIFEAFRQVDGSTQRQYRGTGLGLTISRDLARRLGGSIHVDSTPGEGSTFSLVLPLDANLDTAPPPARAPRPARREGPGPRSTPVAAVGDDRHRLAPSSRTLLVVEDDPRFAAILYDIAHEQRFQCLIAPTAREGYELARTQQPRAIVLDLNLPDDSGLLVLERLKGDPNTRHIPVHVVSVVDYSRRARELGAVGYALKPVKRDELVQAFRELSERAERRAGRLLLVEPAQAERESVRHLLETDAVEIRVASTAGEAVEHLRKTTFDCLVLDLSLPDLSSYELLERMAADASLSFPPVIVYTGRALTADEEARLHRYSSAVVIKGARSPERLVDEVTLFLHRVESSLPREQQRMLRDARSREDVFDGRRVLLVEDDVRNIFALSSVLEPKGVGLEVARNGREALEVVERSEREGGRPIDLVLMDLMMPEMDGLTATRELRRRPECKKLPIIALTAKAMPEDRERCIQAGASDYIAKPVDVPKLLSLMRVWMPK